MTSSESTPSTTAPIAPTPAPGVPRWMLLTTTLVLLLLVGVRLGTLIAPAHAETEFPGADVVSRVGDYTMLTLSADNDDVLLVLDGRNESLAAYRVKNKNAFELVESRDLKAIFAEGRRIGSGK